MKHLIRNILAVVVGIAVGSAANMALIFISSYIIPPPQGADLTTMEGLKASMQMMEPKHFVMPFLAHALGTLVGAYVTAKIAVTHQFKLAMVIGLVFLVGGIMNVAMLPSPLWFNVLDVAVAYLPMAYLGARLAGATRS